MKLQMFIEMTNIKNYDKNCFVKYLLVKKFISYSLKN